MHLQSIFFDLGLTEKKENFCESVGIEIDYNWVNE